MISQKRILNELAIIKESNLVTKINIDNGNIYEWNIKFVGPEDSLYANGEFDLKIIFNENYPIQAPIVKFTSKIRHLNVNQYGNICLHVLKEWSFSYNIEYIILAIYTLLKNPNPDDPFDTDLLKIYNRDKVEYNNIVKNSFK